MQADSIWVSTSKPQPLSFFSGEQRPARQNPDEAAKEKECQRKGFWTRWSDLSFEKEEEEDWRWKQWQQNHDSGAKIDGRQLGMMLEEFPVTYHPTETVTLGELKKESKEFMRRLKKAKLIRNKQIVDFRHNLQELKITPMKQDKLKIYMARLGLEAIPYQEYEHFDQVT